MKTNQNAVKKAMLAELGERFTKNYFSSASMFNAKIESAPKNGYFLESVFDECHMTGERSETQYHLKYIGENVHKVAEFSSLAAAQAFFEKMEFTQERALIVRRYTGPRDLFDRIVADSYQANERLYDNGLSACYSFQLFSIMIEYCEGDIIEIHAPDHNGIFERYAARAVEHFKHYA